MKSFFCSAVLLAAVATPLPAQNTPPAPVPTGAGAVAGSAPPAPAAAPSADASAPADPLVPEELKQYGVDRYDKIVEKSPFNFKIIKQAGAPAISFAADLALAGYTRDVGKGIEYATLVDKKKNTRFVINSHSPNKEGIQLVKLNPQKTLLATTVLARKGGEEHEIKAEKQIVERKAVVAAAVMARTGGQVPPGMSQAPGQPGGPNMNVNLARTNNVQAQINNQLQPPTPGPNPPQQGGASVAGGGVQATAVQTQGPAPTVADQAIARQNPGGRGEGRGDRGGNDGQPQQNKRRVILPPPVNTQ